MATYTLWQGYADSWMPDYDAKNPTCTMRASDGSKILGAFQASGPSAAVGSGENTGTRIGRLADLAQWSATDRQLDTGNATVQPTTLAQNVLQEMQQVELSELGSLYFTEDSKLAFDDRHTYAESSRSNTVQQTFCDDSSVATVMPYTPAAPIFDDSLVRNTINAQIIGGAVQAVSDSTSITKYLTRVRNETGLLLTTDADALNWATWLLYLSKNPENRFDTIQVDPNDDTFPTLIVEAGFNLNPASPYLYFDDTVRGKFNTGQFAGTLGYTDITSKVLRIETARGKARMFEPYQPGSCSIVFSMIDGSIDPNNTAGIYASGGVTYLQPETPIRIRASYTGSDPRWLAVLGSKFHDRFRVVKKAWVTGQASIDQQSFCEAIAHTIVPGRSWSTKFGLVSATYFGTSDATKFLIYDDSTKGKLDSNTFAGW